VHVTSFTNERGKKKKGEGSFCATSSLCQLQKETKKKREEKKGKEIITPFEQAADKKYLQNGLKKRKWGKERF